MLITPDLIFVEDSNLIQRIGDGDKSALLKLYSKYGARVHGISVYILKNSALAEEASQTTFLTIWNTASSWSGEQANITNWILKIARLSAIEVLRREQANFSSTAYFDEFMQNFSLTAETTRDGRSDFQEIKCLFSKLPQEQIEAIELAFLKGMTHLEIAKHLAQPLETIKNNIRNGLQTLRSLWLQETSIETTIHP